MLPKNLTVAEDFSRSAPVTINDPFTIEDPAAGIRRCGSEVPLTATGGRIHEYACHEGNLAPAGIPTGAGEAEKAAAATKALHRGK